MQQRRGAVRGAAVRAGWGRPPAIPLDHGRFEGQAPQLRHLQGYGPGFRLTLACIVAGPRVGPPGRPLIALGAPSVRPVRAVRDDAPRPLRPRLYDALPAQPASEAPSATGPARARASLSCLTARVCLSSGPVRGRLRPAWLTDAPLWRRSVRRDPRPPAARPVPPCGRRRTPRSPTSGPITGEHVAAVEDGAALIAGQEHGDPLGHAGTDQGAGGAGKERHYCTNRHWPGEGFHARDSVGQTSGATQRLPLS